ncbi:hypothetical protein H0H87_000052 [Tephrocybe sp. NHM501043]|nr:hypothetical protein H0H87_000052 [Tephrocybe sp. NHM501043]
MSRLTSAQVIALGEYLEPTFDPASLTVSQLLGVLGYHNVKYPTPYSKPKLAMLFHEEIKSKAAKLKKERVKKANSIASDDGIVDGTTGQPLRKVTRRASRRLSRVPLEEETEEEPTSPPPPPKRRRSSAQPTFGGPSRKSTTQPTLVEESEPEEDLPMKKVGRSRKTAETAGAQARRVSNTAANDSGWEDNNIFQSGAESSSPARPSPVRPKASRRSVPSAQTSRKSSSAPPQMSLQSPPRLPSSPEDKKLSPFSPPQSTFESELTSLPSTNQFQFLRLTPSRLRTPVSKPQLEESGDELDIIGTSPPKIIKEEDASSIVEHEDISLEPEADFSTDSEAIEDPEIERDSQDDTSIERRSSFWKIFGISILVFLMASIAVPIAYWLGDYKTESASIGYCMAGSASNDVLDRLRANRTVDVTPGFCVVCDRGFMLRSHPLLFFLPASPTPHRSEVSHFSHSPGLLRKLAAVFDGLPGFGSVAFPPRCIEDPKRKRNIGALGKAVESLLGQERGQRLCAGGKVSEEDVVDVDGGSAKKWGLELESLRKMMKKKTPPELLPVFDDTFNEAIQQLIQWGGVIIGEDHENHRYVAHTTPSLTWDCIITVKFRELWAQWRFHILISIALALVVLYIFTLRAQKRVETARVAGLVQIALDTLRNQELAHHTDPVMTPTTTPWPPEVVYGIRSSVSWKEMRM